MIQRGERVHEITTEALNVFEIRAYCLGEELMALRGVSIEFSTIRNVNVPMG